jgi:hypothetical protein
LKLASNTSRSNTAAASAGAQPRGQQAQCLRRSISGHRGIGLQPKAVFEVRDGDGFQHPESHCLHPVAPPQPVDGTRCCMTVVSQAWAASSSGCIAPGLQRAQVGVLHRVFGFGLAARAGAWPARTSRPRCAGNCDR